VKGFMFQVKVLDNTHRIVHLIWEGSVTKQEIADSNDALENAIKQVGAPFKFLVDTSKLKLIQPDAAEASVAQQKQFLSRIEKLAVVNTSQLTKLQLRKIGEQSEANKQENFFTSMDEAISFLKN